MLRIVTLLAVLAVAVAGCQGSPTLVRPSAESSPGSASGSSLAAPTSEPRPPAARPLAAEPAQIADGLVADESALRDPASSESLLAAAALRQQRAYRVLGRHPEWDSITRTRIPAELQEVVDRNIDARRQLAAMGRPKDTLPAWRIVEPRPVDELLGYYREAQAASGVDWNYLAAINLIETAFGRVSGVSTAGAQGPMQFMPATFAAYGAGGDIRAPRDSIMAAGRYLAANGFAHDRDHALYRYNNSDQYVQAVHDYAAVIAAHPMALAGYHRWNVYYTTTSGDVVLPLGYAQTAPVPVAEHRGLQPRDSVEVQMSARSGDILDQLLAARRDASTADPSRESAVLSEQFLGTPYGADTLVGSQHESEQLVVELERVDCFTFVDYVEALTRAEDRDQFVDALIDVRYQDGLVGFATRRHFFTDWASGTPAIAADVTADLGADAVTVAKQLNRKDTGGLYLPGLPVVARDVTYLPAGRVDDRVLSRLRTGDYIGAYAEDGGLDVTHVGLFVAGPDGPVLRNASSLVDTQRVVDSPFLDYVRSVPGIVVLRPHR